MRVDSNTYEKMKTAESLLERIKILLASGEQPEVVYNVVSDQVSKIEDIALIQCFYGTDIQRIRATTQAIEFNLHMTSKPSTWIFVECQKKKSDCAFSWLKKYGIKHIFVPMDFESEGIMIKNSLWNIGAEQCSETRLCFVDSDVVMCSSDWIENTANAFESGYDVLSLASHQYYQSDVSCKLYETVGYKWQIEKTFEKGHCGFTIGITREVFKKIGRFDPAIILDDINVFRKIVGDELFSSFKKWCFPVLNGNHVSHGVNCNLGYVDNVACHIWHGGCESKYDNIIKLLCNSGVKSLQDILQFNESGKLPTWNVSTQRNTAIRNTVLNYQKYLALDEDKRNSKEFDILSEYYSELKRQFGEPDENHQLFVCTLVKDGFNLKLEDFSAFRDNVETAFSGSKAKPIVLFFTDCDKFDFASMEINTVPLENYSSDNEFIQCVRKELVYPQNAVVYYIPFGLQKFNVNLWIPSEKIEFNDGTVLVPAHRQVEKPMSRKSKTTAKRRKH